MNITTEDVHPEVAVVRIGIIQWIFGGAQMVLIKSLFSIGLENIKSLKNFGNKLLTNSTTA